MKIAVIGGGWAGIAAAVELASTGIEVTLFEAGRVAGGRARSVNIDGRTLDNGQHILLGAYSETLELMRRIGLDPEDFFERRPLQVIDNTGFRLSLPKWPGDCFLHAASAYGKRSKPPSGWRASSNGSSGLKRIQLSPNGSMPLVKPGNCANICGSHCV